MLFHLRFVSPYSQSGKGFSYTLKALQYICVYNTHHLLLSPHFLVNGGFFIV